MGRDLLVLRTRQSIHSVTEEQRNRVSPHNEHGPWEPIMIDTGKPVESLWGLDLYHRTEHRGRTRRGTSYERTALHSGTVFAGHCSSISSGV